MRSMSGVVTAGRWLVAATVVLGAALAEAQPTSTAPSGDVYSSSANCQTVYQQTAAQINAQHSRDWPACRGESTCMRKANAKKADALKTEGEKLRLCQASRTAEPPPLQPLPLPTVAPEFQPGRPGTWKAQEVTWKGEKWAVYTDSKGQPWKFTPKFTESSDPSRDDLKVTWVLDRSSVNPNGTLNGKKVPTAQYRKEEFGGGGRLTTEFTLKPGYEVENFPYAR
jgi:hypothetical protein